jgi:hypothetical protein
MFKYYLDNFVLHSVSAMHCTMHCQKQLITTLRLVCELFFKTIISIPLAQQCCANWSTLYNLSFSPCITGM